MFLVECPICIFFPSNIFQSDLTLAHCLKVILLLSLLERLPRIWKTFLSLTTAIIQKVDITITELNCSWSTFSKCSLALYPWDWFLEQLNHSHQGLVSFRVAWKTACCDYVQILMHIWFNLYSEEKMQKNWGEHFRHLTAYQQSRLESQNKELQPILEGLQFFCPHAS